MSLSFMNISTELCISRIPGCESCSVSGNSVTCDECQTGLINDGNECKRKCLHCFYYNYIGCIFIHFHCIATGCKMQFCEECEDDLSGCKKCVTGYELTEAQTDCIQNPTLTDVEIIGIIICMAIVQLQCMHMHEYTCTITSP